MNNTDVEIHSALTMVKWLLAVSGAVFLLIGGALWHFHETAKAQAAETAVTIQRVGANEEKISGFSPAVDEFRDVLSDVRTQVSVTRANQSHIQAAIDGIAADLRDDRRQRRRNR